MLWQLLNKKVLRSIVFGEGKGDPGGKLFFKFSKLVKSHNYEYPTDI